MIPKPYRNTLLLSIFLFVCIGLSAQSLPYPIVDTDVTDFYDTNSVISAPLPGSAFYGQDAQYTGNTPSYTDNGNGTVTDNVTGLMWQQDMGAKLSYGDALTKADTMTLGGHSDWRIPTIKELYSLAYFSGRCMGDYAVDMFIDTLYFDQPIGDTSIGEREIDGQTWSQTHYVGLTMGGDSTIFGFNFVDGRLKGYPKYNPAGGAPNTMYFRMVRGNPSYGINHFIDNGNGTITDSATGLMWQQADDSNTYDWQSALAYAEGLSLGGHNDWRLPNAKELQSIVDYTRSPGTSGSPAIDPLFSCTEINDPDGNPGQYGYYWTSSPLQDGPSPYSDAVYFCFGYAQGQMESPPGSGSYVLLDVHGAGAQRNDPKTGNPSDYPDYFGPQGDVRYVYNYVRCVRDASLGTENTESKSGYGLDIYPMPADQKFMVRFEAFEENVVLELLDLNGKRVKHYSNVSGHQTAFETNTLPSGLYLLIVKMDKQMISRKILIQRK